MGQIQKRFIYAGLASAIFFLLVYGILDFNIFLSLILTAIIYFGGILLFKTKDIRKLDSENVNNYYFWASKCANRASLTENELIIELVTSITEKLDSIIVSLSQRPKKVEQVFDFFDYYVDMTYKILCKYNLLKNVKEKKDMDQEFMEHASDYLKKIDDMFAKQLANMQEAKMLSIENEIKIFEESFGIDKKDMEVGESYEKQN